MQVEMWSLDRIKPYENNPRINDDAIDAVAKSVEAWGFDALADPRLFATAPIDPEDSHAAIAQFLEHILASCLATFRGEEATERQCRLADRIIELLLAKRVFPICQVAALFSWNELLSKECLRMCGSPFGSCAREW